jgi:HD-GYP domain
MMSGEPMVVNEVIYLQSHRYYFQIVKAPLTTTAGRQAKGIVSVYRDITDLVEAQERSQRVVQQTIDALVRTIEESDPYLAGHSRYMSIVATMMARDMNLSETDIATIEAAANLSQIGRMFVPKDILNKPGALTKEEMNIMESHVEHSRRVLQNIEFDLPIVDTICEMNERLDGTGYPNKLSGDEIGVDARILAVANAFTAMVRPRSYRNSLGRNRPCRSCVRKRMVMTRKSLMYWSS